MLPNKNKRIDMTFYGSMMADEVRSVYSILCYAGCSPLQSYTTDICPNEEAADAFMTGALNEALHNSITEHIDRCDSCRMLFASLSDSSERVCPDQVGRFAIRDVLGMGAMSAVYRAYDSDLQRDVALKLINTSSEHPLREARAMARVTHANVVPIYEVGHFGDEIFIAMELVEGVNLGTWLRIQDRKESEILSVFMQAGRGLAAAHEAGLVHRDFKPDNVMITRGDIARVTDFGLSGRMDETEGVAIRGTPVYMSPEQHQGGTITQKADQYSYCVALMEAMTGTRPFHNASSPRELQQAKHIGLPDSAFSGLPGWLRRVVKRGMAPKATKRFSDMSSLLVALDRRKVHKRRVAIGAIVMGVGVLAFAIQSGAWLANNDVVSTCKRSDSSLWSLSQAQLLQARMHSSDKDYVATSLRSVQRGLENYQQAWTTEKSLTCAAQKRNPSPLLTERLACLDRRRDEFRIVVEAILAEDSDVVETAVDIMTRLAPPEACGQLSAALPSDNKTAALVSQYRDQLASAHATLKLGQFADALSTTERIQKDSQFIQYPPLQVEVELLLAKCLSEMAEYNAAEEFLLNVSKTAAGIGDDQSVAESFVLLIGLYTNKGDLASAKTTALLAEAALMRAGDGQRLRMRYLNARRHLAFSQGDFVTSEQFARQVSVIDKELHGEESASTLHSIASSLALQAKPGARDYLDRAITVIKTQKGVDHPDIGAPKLALCAISMTEGKLEEARVQCEQAKHVWEHSVGQQHPDYARVLSALCDINRQEEKFAEAIPLCEQALTVIETRLSPDHINVAVVKHSLGKIWFKQGDLPSAQKYHVEGMRIAEKILGTENDIYRQQQAWNGHLFTLQGQYAKGALELEDALASSILTKEKLVTTHEWLSSTYRQQGRFKDAEVEMRHALTAYTTEHGEDRDARYAELLNGLATTLVGQKRLTEARSLLDQSVLILKKRSAPNDPSFGHALNNIGEVLRAEKHYRDALTYYQRANDWFTANGFDVAKGIALTNTGDCYLYLEKLQQAQNAYSDALALWKPMLADNDPLLGYALTGLGQAHYTLEASNAALPFLERALVIRTTLPGDPFELAKTQFTLAKALWHTDRVRAHRLATSAHKTWSSEHSYTQEIAQVNAWLAKHKN